MAERSLSNDWAPQLQQESARWVEAGLLTDDQRSAILALYPEPATGSRDRLILIFTILGSLLVGAGVILFFASNWQALPAWLKVGAILAAVVGAYAAGYHLAYTRGDYPRLGHSLFFLGSLLYGAGIWLVAQIFHLQSDFATGWLLWGLGVLPVVYVTRSTPVLYVSAITLTVWTIMVQMGPGEPHNWFYPLLMAGVAALARRAQSVLAEAGVLVGLFLWLTMGVAQHRGEEILVPQFLLLYGAPLVLAALARLGDVRTYGGLGGVMALLGLYVLTFERQAESHSLWVLWGGPWFQVASAVLLLAAGAVTGWLYWRRGEGGRLPVLIAVLALVPAALVAPALVRVPGMVTFNLLLFAGTVGFIALGIRQRSQLLVNLGLLVFVVHVLTRYFDLFFSAMDKSLFFLLGGVLLLGGGWLLERNRRRWMRDWGGESIGQ